MLFRAALLLSSKGEAEMISRYPDVLVFKGSPQYRLSISQNGSGYKFGVQHASYPNKIEGKGWGSPVYSKTYSEQSFANLEELEAHLRAHNFNLEGWSPVESDDR